METQFVAELETLVQVPGAELAAFLTVPQNASGLVIFAHASGIARFDPENRALARELNDQGIGTLLFDLLAPLEVTDHNNLFDVGLLGERLIEAIRWAQNRESSLPIGLFGAGTGAAAAIYAAAELDHEISTVVSRAGRPDLAGAFVKEVSAPTLLIVSELDSLTLRLNRATLPRLRNGKLEIMAGSSHVLAEAGDLASRWFTRYFSERLERISA
jgi:putative phosphoribosyl transferase